MKLFFNLMLEISEYYSASTNLQMLLNLIAFNLCLSSNLFIYIMIYIIYTLLIDYYFIQLWIFNK